MSICGVTSPAGAHNNLQPTLSRAQSTLTRAQYVSPHPHRQRGEGGLPRRCRKFCGRGRGPRHGDTPSGCCVEICVCVLIRSAWKRPLQMTECAWGGSPWGGQWLWSVPGRVGGGGGGCTWCELTGYLGPFPEAAKPATFWGGWGADWCVCAYVRSSCVCVCACACAGAYACASGFRNVLKPARTSASWDHRT